MADNAPSSSSGESVAVVKGQLGRLWTFTLLSLGLNVLILALLVVGAIIHHHQEMRDFGGRNFGGRGGMHGGAGYCPMGWGHRFHHFGGMGWGGHGGFGMRHNEDTDRAPSGFGRGPGGPGLFGGGPGGPPDPAKMTDGIMAMLSNQLALTDDEKTRIKPIVQDQVAQLQAQREAQRAAMQKQIEDAKAKIRPLLTPDQQKQLDALPVPGQKPPGQ